MGAIEGVVVLSSTNEPILHSHFTHPLASYPTLHADQLVAKLEASQSSNEEVIPVSFTEGVPIVANDDLIDDDDQHEDEEGAQDEDRNAKDSIGSQLGAAVVYIEHNRLKFLATFSESLDPLIPLSFLRTLLVNLELYLGSPLTEEAIREHFDVVYQVLEEMLDESGQPLNTEYNTLRELVREPSWLDSVVNRVGALSGISTNTALGYAMSQPHISPIPWRRPATSAGPRATGRNEMYIDIVEILSGIYSRSPHPRPIGPIHLQCHLEANCKLSKTPDVVLRVSDTKRIVDASFHPCVRIRQWKKEQSLSFVPPEGAFTLAEFEMESVGALERHVPISLVCVREEPPTRQNKDGHATTFSVTLSCQSAVEDVEVTFGIAEKSCSIETALSGGSRAGVASEDLNALKGTFHYDAKLGLARWSVGKLTPDQRPLELRGTMRGGDGDQSRSFGLSTCVSCQFTVAQRTSLSGVKVDKLEIVNDVGYTPVKGVRSMLKGNIDWRW